LLWLKRSVMKVLRTFSCNVSVLLFWVLNTRWHWIIFFYLHFTWLSNWVEDLKSYKKWSHSLKWSITSNYFTSKLFWNIISNGILVAFEIHFVISFIYYFLFPLHYDLLINFISCKFIYVPVKLKKKRFHFLYMLIEWLW